MTSAASAASTTTPHIVFHSRKAGLISIVEEELSAEDQSPLAPSYQAPSWRDIDYFDGTGDQKLQGLGVKRAYSTGCSLVVDPRDDSLRVSSIPTSTWNALPEWGMVPSHHDTTLRTSSQPTNAKGLWTQWPHALPQLSSVIPDISDDEASRHGSIAELEISLRKASIVQSQDGKNNETKIDIDALLTEESDVLGPLHSPLTPLTPRSPSVRTSTSPRASSECLGATSIVEDRPIDSAYSPKRPNLSPSVVFKKMNHFADLNSFSFGQKSKARKESGAGADPMSSPRLSTESSIKRPPSARISFGSSVDCGVTEDVMLVNPITGERKMSVVKSTDVDEQVRRPSALRRSSSSTSMYTLVRRESVAASKTQTRSAASRPSLSGRGSSTAASSSQSEDASSTSEQHLRNLSSWTQHTSGASNARAMSNTRTVSHSSSARTPSYTRTTSTSTWSRMSTFSRASSTSSVTTYDSTYTRHNNQETQAECDEEKASRSSSFLIPLFGQLQRSKTDSTVALPIQEPKPAYQEALADVEEDPDFVEVEIEPKAGPIARRASLIANVFTNNDVDVDPDLKFEPSASEADIMRGVAGAENERSQRKMVYSRNIAVSYFVIVNGICVALSFGLFSVWYAIAPLVLAAHLSRSAMALNLVGLLVSRMAKVMLRSGEEKGEPPSMDYATVVNFSRESLEDMEGVLDSLVDQKDVDMHKNLLLVSCNDKMLNGDQAKSTTRVLLENILTNIIDEAKFQIPCEGQNAGYDNLWCRRGIYKGLPYVLMIKEGVTSKTETLDLIRNLLRSYNLRKESYHNSVPPAFFAWYQEWAELHDFASFDFLVNASSDSLLDGTCIAELYNQFLEHPDCSSISSRVEVDYHTSRWCAGNLIDNACLVHEQLRYAHQSQITHRVISNSGACQMIKICEETCGPQILEDNKRRRPSPMSNIATRISAIVEEDDALYGAPEVISRQAVYAVSYTHPTNIFSDFLSQRKRLTFSTCAINLAVLRDSQMGWFERLSAVAELMAWCLPVVSLAIMINFLRSAALQQNIPVLIVVSAVVALPWIYAFASAMWLARSWDARLRYLLGFCFLAIAGPFIAIYTVISTFINLHHVRPGERKRRRYSATSTTTNIQPCEV
ncbi:hypothetical protein E4T42_05416 [Aureobasidium subglaciale]|nr:hypothetical protein E4T42_05416 [Aureobasidium subglaciale]